MLARTVRGVARAPAVYARALAGAAPLAEIDASKTIVKRTESPKAKQPNDQLKFGATFSDHMLEVDWNATTGWQAPVISAYHSFQLDPAASVLHYALECFEGMKAYKDAEGHARLFRPDMNIARMRRSMKRLAFPEPDAAQFQKLLEQVVSIDKDWIPEGDGFSLYLRPTAISTHPFIGVGKASQIKLYCIMSPVGPYYPEGFKPVTLYADTVNVRAWPGGTGDAKIGSNYGPTIQPQIGAAEKGYSQVLWLFGDKDGGQITEVGTMNMFVLWDKPDGKRELVTAPLDGTILPGVTRDSILTLTKEWGEFDVVERPITMGELARAADEGRVCEAFGAGTAAVVSPIRKVHWKGTDYNIPVDEELGSGPVAKRVWKQITDIQYGRIPHPWSVRID